MATTVWTVNVDGREHKIELVHRWMTGTRRVNVDGEVVHRNREWFTSGNILRIMPVLEGRAQVWLVTHATTYAYYLFMDGRPVPSDRERAKGIDSEKLLSGRTLRDMRFWLELADRLGLHYVPMADAMWQYRHRLVGRMNGAPVLVFISGENSLKTVRIKPYLTVVAGHADVTPEDVSKSIVDDPRLPDLMPGMTLKQSDVAFSPIKTELLVPYDWKKQDAADVAQGIRNFVRLVSEHAPALPPDVCEECGRKTTPRLALPNYATPALICQDCLDKMPEKATEARRAYEASPSKLGRGALAGLGISLLLSPVFAALIVILERVGAILGMAAFYAILKGMDRVGTRRTGLSMFVAALLCAPAIFLSVCLVVAWAAWQEGMTLSPAFFTAVVEVAWTSELLRLMAYFTGLGAAVMGFTTWLEQRQAVAKHFLPDMELAPEPSDKGRASDTSRF